MKDNRQVYVAHITVSRTYEVEIAAVGKSIAERAAYATDTLWLHQWGKLNDVEIEHVELYKSGQDPDMAKISVPKDVTPRLDYDVQDAWFGKRLVFMKPGHEWDGVPWEDKIKPA